MARTAVPTLLSLNRYARVMGLPAAAFNNLNDGSVVQSARAYWTQDDHDELAVYIAQAESKLAAALHFDVAPVARQGARLWLPSRDTVWWQDTLTAPHGHLVAFGAPVFTALEEGAAVAIAGDTATVTVTGVDAGLDPAAVRMYLRVSDGADTAHSAAYRVHDVLCRVTGTTLTISGPKAYFALPAVLEAETPADYADSASYATAVDVYVESIDAELPVTAVWDSVKLAAGGDPTGSLTQDCAARIVDSAPGALQARPAVYAAGEHAFTYPAYSGKPEYLLANYVAGYALADGARGRMDARLEAAVVRLANVLSPDYRHPLNDLAESKWRGDRAMPGDDNPLRPDELDSPFGYAVGARLAWDVARQMRNYPLPFGL